jgi:hypothetical protein
MDCVIKVILSQNLIDDSMYCARMILEFYEIRHRAKLM